MRGFSSVSIRVARVATAAAAIFALGACEDEANSTGPDGTTGEAPINTVVTTSPLNGTSADTLIAFSLAKNAVVPKSGDWDILLRRYEIRVNSAATAGATNKNVTAYALNNNKTKTDAEVLAYTVDNTLPAFDAVRASSIPAESEFKADRLEENKYGYLLLNGAPVVNSAAFWKVKTANGGYAAFRATAIAYGQTGLLTSLTLETRVQNGSTLGAVQTFVVPFTGATRNISLVSNGAVTPSGCNWDISVDPRAFEMTVNTACGVGTSPGGSSPTFANATSASDAPQYSPYIAELYGPIPNSISDLGAPFRYNLQGTNRLHPTFNIYLIKSGTKVYKLQVINYYNESGAGGYPTLRVARIQ